LTKRVEMAGSTGVLAGRHGRLRSAVLLARRSRLPWTSVIILGILIVCAVFAPLLAPYDPNQITLVESRIPRGRTVAHPFGKVVMGRDMLSRLIFGARNSAMVSMSALAVGMTLGTTLGLVSGYAGKWVDTIIMRFTDAVLGFPSILAAMIIIVLLGSGVQNVIAAVTFTTWARFSRMIRGEVLSAKERDYVTLARAIGVPPHIIVWRHIFSGVVNTLMVISSLLVAQVILLEASLSFLGLGFPPGAPAWGIRVAEGRQMILQVWWLSLFPGVVITTVVLAFNFLGDWIRDTLDPNLRRL
jgi:peptide/nickel transport system permease protein